MTTKFSKNLKHPVFGLFLPKYQQKRFFPANRAVSFCGEQHVKEENDLIDFEKKLLTDRRPDRKPLQVSQDLRVLHGFLRNSYK